MSPNRRLSEHAGRWAGFFSDESQASLTAICVGGVVVPLLLAAYGTRCVLWQAGTLIGRGGVVHLSGSAAVAYGIAFLGAAVFLTAHFLFSKSERFYVVSEVGQPLGLLGLAGGIFYMLVRWIVFS